MTSYETDALTNLRASIELLTKEQAQSLKRATYTGMTAKEAQHFDVRQTIIKKVREELSRFEKGAEVEAAHDSGRDRATEKTC